MSERERGRRALQRRDLHLDAEQCLDRPVVQLARDPGAFLGGRACAQPADQEHVGQRGRDVVGEGVEEVQRRLDACAVASDRTGRPVLATRPACRSWRR